MVREENGYIKRYSRINEHLAVNPPEADWGFETLPGSFLYSVVFLVTSVGQVDKVVSFVPERE